MSAHSLAQFPGALREVGSKNVITWRAFSDLLARGVV